MSGWHTAPAAVLYMLWASTEEWEASNMAANTCQQKKLKTTLRPPEKAKKGWGKSYVLKNFS